MGRRSRFRSRRMGRSRGKIPRLRTLRRRAQRPVTVRSIFEVASSTLSFGTTPQPSVSPATITVGASGGVRLVQGVTTATPTYYASAFFNPVYGDFPEGQWSSLYDEFRFLKAQVKLKAFQGSTQHTNTVGGLDFQGLGVRIHSIIDHDGRTGFTLTNPANDLAIMREYPTYHNDVFGLSWSRTFVPALVTPLYSGTVNVSTNVVANTGRKYKQWIDLAAGSAVKHFGLYIIFEMNGGTLGSVKDFAAEIEYVVQFRGRR